MTTRTKPIYVCNPPPRRCSRPVDETFDAGISPRHSPSCTGNVCGLFACDGANWRVTTNGTLDRSHWIEGWIISQLFTRGQVDCREHPFEHSPQQGKIDGGWWADSFRTASTNSRFKSGSKLWALKWSPVNNETLMKAQQYAQDALAPLLMWGVVSNLTVTPMYIGKDTIHLHIKVSGPGVASTFTIEGQAQPQADWLWRSYYPKHQDTGAWRS